MAAIPLHTNKNNTVYYHLLIWMILCAIILIRFNFVQRSFSHMVWYRFAIDIGLFYINYALMVPYLLLRKKIWAYILGCGLLVLSSIYISRHFPGFMGAQLPEHLRAFVQKPIGLRGFPIMTVLLQIGLGTAIRLYQEWHKNELKRKDIQTQKVGAQLQLLRHQLNPHFLFNSLNSIYSLTRKQSTQAPEAVLTLSELMRYMLYQSERDWVKLDDEISYIQSYFKLQLLRIANTEYVTINVHGDISTQRIRPLLLISFIENAFKYGTDYMGNTFIKVVFTVAGDQLNFSCSNLLGRSAQHGQNHGIGLNNTRERLDFLYPDRYQLDIHQEADAFHVNLQLDLSDEMYYH
ncbi:sensor histidine kinase [Sediminicola luteus]|uniref:Signal transduction histidine kinase internal region domain-containing protein n=1 Tax=Sediminicola luteus TaxID=319238 RepID=A0A2A4G3V9_9FLAO|nr:histidine kinase [Sediminicola luteus]PCE62646.1 hypothetical protein B7P33_18610 [Sediminicola luteus]